MPDWFPQNWGLGAISQFPLNRGLGGDCDSPEILG